MPTWILRLGEIDERLLRAVVTRRRGGLDLVVRLITRLGDPPMAAGLAGALALGMVPSLSKQGEVAAFTLAFSFLLGQVLKRSFSRSRPSLPVGISSLIQAPDRFSFPSGHATAGLAIALPLALAVGFPIGMFILALGLAVGLTRCYLGVHYPGDVVAGWGLAVLAYLPAEYLLTVIFG
jgi:undecaprenyl-diphosphatase